MQEEVSIQNLQSNPYEYKQQTIYPAINFLIQYFTIWCNRHGMKHATTITPPINNVLKGWNTWNNPNLLSFVHMPMDYRLG